MAISLRVTCSLSVAFVVSSCANAPAADPATTVPVALALRGVDFLPMSRRPEDGGRWLYTLFGDAERPVEMTGWIFERRSRLGRLQDAFNQYVGGGLAKTIWFRVDDALSLEYHALEPDRPLEPLVYAPPVLLLPASFEVGDRWSWSGDCNGRPASLEIEVVSLADERTPLGDRATVLVREHRRGMTIDRWFACGVGLLRTARNGIEVLRLERWTPGGGQGPRDGGR